MRLAHSLTDATGYVCQVIIRNVGKKCRVCMGMREVRGRPMGKGPYVVMSIHTL